MNPIKQFDEYLFKGNVKKQSPDKSRAKFLIKESEQNYKYLLELIEKMKINNRNANDYIKKCYDILMEMIRAKMLLDGLKASGFGAHQAEVAYLRKLEIKEQDVQFLDKVRFFRNGMLYYGTILDREYAEKVIEFMNHLYAKLKRMFDYLFEYHGIIIYKSLKDKAIISDLKILSKRKSENWVLYKIGVMPDNLEDVIGRVKNNMINNKYYSHFYKDDELIVVFKKKIFRVSTDKSSWKEVVEYGRTLKIPEEQLDFFPCRIGEEEF